MTDNTSEKIEISQRQMKEKNITFSRLELSTNAICSAVCKI